jgi:PAS domain S-box-containing protein
MNILMPKSILKQFGQWLCSRCQLLTAPWRNVKEQHQIEARLHAVINALDEGIIVFDHKGKVVMANPVAEHAVGLTWQDMPNFHQKVAVWKPIREDGSPFPVDDMPLAQALFEGKHITNVVMGDPKVTGVKWLLVNAAPIGETHDTRRVVFSFTDITEQKEMQDTLRRQEASYRSLFENTMNSVVHARMIFDGDQPVDLIYLATNPAFATITGITTPVIGRKISDVIPHYCENNPESLAVFDGVAKTGVSRRWEHYLPELDRWFSFMIYSPKQDEVVIITENITQRKQAELALAASEKRFADIVAASADWTWEVDETGHYTYVSDGVIDALGYTALEVVGKTPFDFMPPNEAQRVGREFAKIIAQRKTFRDLENVNHHKNGSLRYMQTNGTPILDAQGNLLGYRGMDRDITQRKQAELALQQQTAELESRNAELERFNRAMVGRELDMIALKQQINALSQQLGQTPPYCLAFLDEVSGESTP